MNRLIPLLFIIVLASCATTNQPGGSTAAVGEKHSPSNVVINFLDAIRTNDYGSAYKYIHSPMTDKQGYVSRMKDMVEKSKNRINDIKLIGTRIVGEIAYVVVELELELDINSTDKNLWYTKNQYELNLIEGKWKIVKDHGCIENCTNTEKG